MTQTEMEILLRNAMRDKDISRLMDSSPKLRSLIRRMYGEIQRLAEDEDDDGSVFPVKSGAETRLLRTCDIYFFEAQGRKIALRTKAQEIAFYSSFEQLLEQLPDWFLRCHRGYIINLKKLGGVNFAEGTISMSDGSDVPFSRSYRDSVRAALERFKAGERQNSGERGGEESQ